MSSKNASIEQFVDVYKQTNKLIFKLIQDIFIDVNDLQYAAYHLLHYVYSHERCTQRQIARDFFHTEAAISRMVNELVVKGYLIRTVPKEDRRKSIIEVSENGRAKVKRLESRINKVLTDIFSDLSASEIENITNQNKRIQEIVMKGMGQ